MLTGGRIYGRQCNFHYVILGIAVVFVLACCAALLFAVPLKGGALPQINRLDMGWKINRQAVRLPCEIDNSEERLVLERSTDGLLENPHNVLVFRTRYTSIRVWVDTELVYEAAQGKEHAFGSMWHFIPGESLTLGETLRIELVRYQEKDPWTLESVFFDHLGAIFFYLFVRYLPILIFFGFSMLLAVMLFVLAGFAAGYKIPGAKLLVSFALFLILSGLWVLLDSKLTTLWGGNFAWAYFLSYAAFYLMVVPFILYIQCMLGGRNRALHILAWTFIVNAGVCFLLHIFGWVPIQDTAFMVHILIGITFVFSVIAFWKSVVIRRERALLWTFIGTVIIFGTGVVSIILYYTGVLRPANRAALYVYGMLLLIICMMLDVFFVISRFWRQKEKTDQYRRMANEDSMTGMENRNAFTAYTQELCGKEIGWLGVVIFDLDNLKEINDRYGHAAGDKAIAVTAGCVRDAFAQAGRCYRIGGDEFCVILAGGADVKRLLSRYTEYLAERGTEMTYPASVSFGWAAKQFPAGEVVSEKEIQRLMAQADQNMYQQKREKGAGAGKQAD